MDLLSLSPNRSSSSGSNSSSDSVNGGGKEAEDNDASNAKQDRSINSKYRANIIAEEEDRISNLPVDIIHRILSSLDMIYAVQSSTLSKKWKHIWTSMPYLRFNSQMFHTLPQFAKFVKHVLSHRNHHTDVSSVKLYFTGLAGKFAAVVKSVIKYAYLHNVKQLTIMWSRHTKTDHQLPQSLFSSHTLKHLIFETHCYYELGQSVPKSAWNFPALETLYLSKAQLGYHQDKSLDLFSKCVNLKVLTLHQCAMTGLDVFNICAPRLSNLTIIDPDCYPKVFNVVAPQLKYLTAPLTTTNPRRSYGTECFNVLQLSTEGLGFLKKVSLSMPTYGYKKEKFAPQGPQLLDLFKKICSAKYLILDMIVIEALSSSLDQILHEPCPFNNLKCLKIKTVPLDNIPTMSTKVKNYLLQSSPSAIFISDLPQVSHKRSRQEVDKDNMAKKMARLGEEKQQPETIAEEMRSRQEVDKDNMADKMAILEEEKQQPETIAEETRSRQEVDKDNMADKMAILEEEKQQPETIAEETRSRQEVDKDNMADEMAILEEENHQPETIAEETISRQEVDKGTTADKAVSSSPDQLSHEPSTFINYLHESSPSTSNFIMDLPQVSQKNSKQEVDKGTMAKKLTILEEEKQQTETMAEEKRILEEKIQMQDETIAQQKAMLEAMKLQHEKRMLEAKIEMQDKVIAQQKSMMEEIKLQNENGTMEAKIQIQDLVIAEQKSMLEAMKLQNVKKVLVEKLQTQDDIIAQ